jgi:hypothetical protein
MATWKATPATINTGSATNSTWFTWAADTDPDWPGAIGSGVLGFIRNRNASEIEIGYRMKGSNDDTEMRFEILGGDDFMVGMFIGTDPVGNEIEIYSTNFADIDFYVVAFFDHDAVFLQDSVLFTTTPSTWDNVDFSGTIPAGAGAMIGLIKPTDTTNYIAGTRHTDENTQSFEDTIPRGVGIMQALNANQEAEIWKNNNNAQLRVVGYTPGGWEINQTSMSDISVPNGLWHNHVAHTGNTDALGAILTTQKTGGGGQSFAFRGQGATYDIQGFVAFGHYPVRTNTGNGEFEIQGGGLDIKTYFNLYNVAYTPPSGGDPTIHRRRQMEI